LTTNVAFIGLGAMGRPMARHLARSGFAVTGYDPYAPALEDDQFLRAGLAATAVADADVVALMVATPAQAEDALTGEDGVLEGISPGTTVVVMATIGPEAAEALSVRIVDAGGTMIDAPVSGGVARAGTGDLLIMASGEAAAFDRADEVLAALGGDVFRLGPRVGDAQRMKLVNQLLCGVHIAVAGEALAFARSLGIDPADALRIVSSGAAASFMLADRGARMVEEDFARPRSAIDIFVKDLGLVRHASSLSLPLADAAFARFAEVSAEGYGRLDDSAVITAYASHNEE
jgi:3-hydroxyisobutyrate dehydrogenase-like beta-hydroxyacid dehydrogenase